jgi:hypothetical protein
VIPLVTEAIGSQELPVVYLLGEKYVKSLENISQSDNGKTVVFPADLPDAIRGLMGRQGAKSQG